jgi:hypothetical protein
MIRQFDAGLGFHHPGDERVATLLAVRANENTARRRFWLQLLSCAAGVCVASIPTIVVLASTGDFIWWAPAIAIAILGSVAAWLYRQFCRTTRTSGLLEERLIREGKIMLLDEEAAFVLLDAALAITYGFKLAPLLAQHFDQILPILTKYIACCEAAGLAPIDWHPLDGLVNAQLNDFAALTGEPAAAIAKLHILAQGQTTPEPVDDTVVSGTVVTADPAEAGA